MRMEIIRFLHNIDLIPTNIPKLPLKREDCGTKIPGRLTQPNPKLAHLTGEFRPLDLDDISDAKDGEEDDVSERMDL